MNGLTLVVQGPPEASRVQRYIGRLPDGEPGTEATIASMVALIRDAAQHPIVRDMAGRIAQASPRAPVDGVFLFLKRSMRKHKDPDGVELLRHPARIIQLARAARRAEDFPIGDCDDRADLGATLLLAMQLKPTLTVIARTPSGPYEHVYCGAVADGSDRPYPIDPQELAEPGREIAATRRRVFSVL